MLEITVPGRQEYWDERKREFIFPNEKDVVLRLEHSLISLSKWESKWCVPFIDSEKTDEQILDYIRCMVLNSNVDESVFDRLTMENMRAINDYISAPMTATTVTDHSNKKHATERITSELIYYWMIAYNIPVEFEKWHLNRLIMLIRVCSAKNEAPKKMSRNSVMRQNRAINEARKARLHTRG